MREGLYYEYVYQILFGQASKAWIHAKITRGKKQKLSDTLPNPYYKIFNQETEPLNKTKHLKIQALQDNFQEDQKLYPRQNIFKKYPSQRIEDKGKDFLTLLVEKHVFKLLYSKDSKRETKKIGRWKAFWNVFEGFDQEYENIIVK